ncbi:MAG: hypothetical protein AB7L66_05140 [Gemmatimonadales bacterium]
MHVLAKHVAFILGLSTFLACVMVYPFLPGRYDRLALPLSTMVQMFGVIGLALVPGAVLWLVLPKYRVALAVFSAAIGTCIAFILALFASLSGGYALGMLMLAAWADALALMIPGLKQLKGPEARRLHPAPLYLLFLPILTVVTQLAMAAPVTRWSRDQALAAASAFIADIEQYHARHGRYPLSLQAQYGDYDPHRVGIDRYVYGARGHSYNLSFEQPRFLLDDIGAREWVVYNPRDEHRVYSHTSWLLLSSDAAEPLQGWYTSGDTGYAHWRYFLFD